MLRQYNVCLDGKVHVKVLIYILKAGFYLSDFLSKFASAFAEPASIQREVVFPWEAKLLPTFIFR